MDHEFGYGSAALGLGCLAKTGMLSGFSVPEGTSN